MTADKYREALPVLGFSSIIDAGRWLGVADRTARRYAEEEGPSPPVARLFELMLALKMTADDVDAVCTED